jgi:LacI family transcriptional regulator
MVSIKDIAKAVGASPSSVSIVLNGKAKQKRISEKLTARIEEAASEMGYYPNRMAVGLRTGKSKTIGLIVENISNNFFSSLAKIVEDEARKFGYNIVYCSTENDASRGKEEIQMLYNQQVDGYLITPANGMEKAIENLLSQNKPVVLMDRNIEGLPVPFVAIDNFSAMKQGIDFLIEVGHKQIGLVTVDLELQQMKDRERAYKESLIQHQLKYNTANTLKLKYGNTASQSVALISAFLGQRNKLTAVVFSTNYLGIYGLRSIQQLQLNIPNDLAVLCFDDNEIFELHSPPITVIKQPINEIAKTAVEILIGQLGHTKAVEQTNILLQARLIIRKSV